MIKGIFCTVMQDLHMW